MVMTVHDLKLACPAYTMMCGGKPCERCRGGKLYNVAVNRCIKGSLALSSLVMVGVLSAPAGCASTKPTSTASSCRAGICWKSWCSGALARERFVHIPNFVDTRAASSRGNAPAGASSIAAGSMSSKASRRWCAPPRAARQPLTLVGAGPLEAKLRALSAERDGDVVFTGHLSKDALVAVIQDARAVVVPSECHENAPLGAARSLCGRPPRHRLAHRRHSGTGARRRNRNAVSVRRR